MNDWMSRALGFARSQWSSVFASVVVAAFAYTLCIRSINLSDEGYLLSQVVDMLNGKVLYRDMDAFVTPGIWFLLGGLFKLVEPSVLASRILSFSGFLGTTFVCYRIVIGLTSRAWAWSTVALLMIFSIWAFPAWTMAFYSPIAIFFALAALDRLLTWQAGQRGHNLLLCGLLLGLSILVKQNYGAFASAGVFLSLIAFRVEAREPPGVLLRGLVWNCLSLSAGGLAVLLPAVAYFAYNGALYDAFESLILHPFVFLNRQDIAFPSLSLLWASTPLPGVDALTYGAYSFNQAPNPFYSTNPALAWIIHTHLLARLHVLLFWIPVLCLIVGGFLSLRPSGSRRTVDGRLFATLAVAGFVFMGVFPRADFNHLINVYQPMIVASVLVVHHLLSGLTRPFSVVARSGTTLGCMLLLVYSGVAASWYSYTLRTMNVSLESPRGGVLVNSIAGSLVDFHVRTIRQKTDPGDFVLTLPGLAMLNFLADRPMPGRYYNLYEHHIAHDQGAGVVAAAEEHHVNLVVAEFNNFFSDRVGLRDYAPELATYLRNAFETEFDVAGQKFQYLKRREPPIEDRTVLDLIDVCDIEAGRTTYAREHLLFASIYHSRDEERPATPIDTLCTFDVPERAQLAVAIGYRKPATVAKGATLTAEIWLADGKRSKALFSTTLPVEPRVGWDSRPAREYHIDLAEFAGREVTLLLRSRFRGAAKMPPLDSGGYSLIWQDLRLETRHDRVLLVGIDGATLRVIEPLIAAGRLPNLAAIARNGVSGPLRSAFPLVSPRIWTSIATGKVPLKHGIHHWVKKGQSGGTRLMLGTDRKVPAIWNITSAYGFSNGIINWLQSYPPEKINGVVISDFAIAGQRKARESFFAGNTEAKGHVGEVVTYPAEWTEILAELTTDKKPLLDHENPFDNNTALPSWLNQTIPSESFRDDDLVTRIALEVDERVHPDLLMVYLSGIDKVSHYTWGALEPSDAYPPHIRFSDAEREATAASLEDYYVYTDELIGKIVERYGPNDLVMIVSDHGFEAQLLVEWLTGGHDSPNAIDGILFARGSRIAKGQKTVDAEITDITPTILAWLGLPNGYDMDGKVSRFVQFDSISTIPSYDEIPVERVQDESGDVEDSIMDQLRGLGYVE